MGLPPLLAPFSLQHLGRLHHRHPDEACPLEEVLEADPHQLCVGSADVGVAAAGGVGLDVPPVGEELPPVALQGGLDVVLPLNGYQNMSW